jgi:hypothetical protein
MSSVPFAQLPAKIKPNGSIGFSQQYNKPGKYKKIFEKTVLNLSIKKRIYKKYIYAANYLLQANRSA